VSGGGRVDAHHHLWDPARRDYPWMAGAAFDPIRRAFTAADLAAAATPHGVSQAVVVQARAEPSETPDLLEIAAGDPLIAGVVGWVDLATPNVAEVLAGLRARPDGAALVGIRHLVQDEPDPEWLLRADVQRGLEAVADAGLVYDLLVRPRELPAAVATVDRLPQARFVLDHAAKPGIAARAWEPWASELTALARHPHVWCKLSGLVTEADWSSWKPPDLRPYVDHVREAFGDDRLMFGSDWPVCLLAASYAQVTEALEEALSDATAEARDRIFGATAREVYGLPAPG
jgi:L-fuconolactonase